MFLNKKKKNNIKEFAPESLILPVISLRDVVPFPSTIVPLFISRKKSIDAIKIAQESNKDLFLVSQIEGGVDDVILENCYTCGCLGKIIQYSMMPDGIVKILVSVNKRLIVKDYFEKNNVLFADCFPFKFEPEDSLINDALLRLTFEKVHRIIKIKASRDTEKSILYIKANKDFLYSLEKINSIETSVFNILSIMHLDIRSKQKLLESKSLSNIIKQINDFLEKEIEINNIMDSVESNVDSQFKEIQKENYLREQLKAIRSELGERGDIGAIEQKFEEAKKKKILSKNVQKRVEEEMEKIKNTSASSVESGIIKAYIETLLALPCNVKTKDSSNIKNIIESLNEGHYGMDKIKNLVTEVIAEQIRTKKTAKSVICLIGPPGVGKTSFVSSIAKALNKKLVKISLGGVSDEAEIRGHRKTYVGAMPGRVVKALINAKCANPLILLDEIDKMGKDGRGDPASALLEVLDFEQNKKFFDNYLDLELDISNVMFICTANSYNMYQPLIDRMDIIDVPSYILQEKVRITKEYILPKLYEEIGISQDEIVINEDLLEPLIHGYTAEAGIRELSRLIRRIIRKCLIKIEKNALKNKEIEKKIIILNKKKNSLYQETELDEKIEQLMHEKKKLNFVAVDKNDLFDLLGPQIYNHYEKYSKDSIGVTNGLAYTSAGGVLLSIEATLMPFGKGNINFTGKLGKVMEESCKVAMSLIKSKAVQLGIDKRFFSEFDIHIHAPEGATPKDGPSAGVTLSTTIVSLLLGQKVKSDVAMTGEITLTGKVLPIGGLREKIAAAVRNEIKKVLIPQGNEKDLHEIPEFLKNSVQIIPCKTLDDVLLHALNIKKSYFAEGIIKPDLSKLCLEEKKKNEKIIPIDSDDINQKSLI